MPSNYVLLERIELNASAASVTFSNIPQSGYTDLKIVLSARCDAASAAIKIGFNGSTTNLSTKYLYGSGSAASSAAANEIYAYTNSSAYTASTFGNSEIYIPNYASSTVKSVSVDAVTENNATGADMLLAAGLWNITAAITSVALVPNSGNFVQYSTFSLYGLAAVGTTPVIAPKASGGNITTDGTYWIHTFNSTGTFTPLTSLSCDYLVVAGGGGGGGLGNGVNGGYPGAGGGGAGGYRTSIGGSALSVTAQAYTITVGAGGTGKTGTGGAGASGTNSVFSTITSTGGGGGNSQGEAGTVPSGGSGGGAGTQGNNTGGLGNTPSTSPSQGNNGGAHTTGDGASGGGGASAAGATNSGSAGGAGGAGSANSISGSSVTYAGGGGGGSYSGASGGAGGAGGGGNGNTYNSGVSTAQSGTTNLGGGGGGAAMSSPTVGLAGGNGGSGIVIIRYAM
jgi:hypothetical protein